MRCAKKYFQSFSAYPVRLLSAAFACALAAAAHAAAPDWLDAEIKAHAQGLTELRRELHQMPELGNQEYKTQSRIIDILKASGIEVVTGWKNAPTAVIGILNPDKGRTIALRADIDALPIKENTGLSYASKAKGMFWGKEADVSHMCGHDAHMAMLLTAAQILAKHKNDVDRRIVFVFQPAEEGDSLHNPLVEQNAPLSGAKALVEAGLTERYDIKHYFGIHVSPKLEAGDMRVSPDAALNSADAFEIRITGEQSHGSMPWTGADAALAAAQTIVSLQQIVSRNIDLTNGMGVITVGKLTAGETGNVMPGSAYMLGTIRSNHADIRAKLLERIPEVAHGTAHACGTMADVKIIEIYPVTTNDPTTAAATVENLKAFGVKARLETWNPGASEDFSFYGQKVPSVFMFLGVGEPGKTDKAANNHSDKFVIDDSALSAGVRAHIAAAMSD